MNWEKLIGPGTLVYLVTITIGGVWWASDISTRMAVTERKVESGAQADGRIVRLEVLITRLDTQLDRIETKLDRRADAQ